jgi:L,D-transpeptidase ErfK/SrfK
MSPALLALLLAASPRAAGDVIGELGRHVVAPGESLIELAPVYDVGFNAIAAANPDLDPFVPRPGAVAVVPTAWILPAATTPGEVTVNLSEMRLYYVPAAGAAPVTFPIGVAMNAQSTPLGRLTIEEKTVSPTWYPTPNILEEDPTLPEMVPPGPDNPLGSRAMRLSARTILIHGTNRPFGVGRKVSHGCLRLYEEDVASLFELVAVGTPVRIVREPVKVGVRQGRVFVESHDDAAVAGDPVDEVVRLLEGKGLLLDVDPGRLVRAVRARSGVPVDVTAE